MLSFVPPFVPVSGDITRRLTKHNLTFFDASIYILLWFISASLLTKLQELIGINPASIEKASLSTRLEIRSIHGLQIGRQVDAGIQLAVVIEIDK